MAWELIAESNDETFRRAIYTLFFSIFNNFYENLFLENLNFSFLLSSDIFLLLLNPDENTV